MAESTGGLRLERELRRGACGVWWSASTADGRTRGLLQLDEGLTAAPDAVARAAAQVTAVRTANLPGVVPTTDLVADAGRVWLVAAAAPFPVLADLLSTLDPAAAALVALDTGRALVHLHAAGLVHGALTPQTVLVTAQGTVALLEVGLAASLHGTAADVRGDALGWSHLVRAISRGLGPDGLEAVPSGAVATGAIASGAVAFDAVAAQAEAGDLAGALRTLSAQAANLPGFPARASLIAAVAAVPVPSPAPAPAATPPSARAQTLLPAQPAAPSSGQATQLGKRAAAAGPLVGAPQSRPGDDAIRMRFGPGVPAPAPAPAPAQAGPAPAAPPRTAAPAAAPGSTSSVPRRHRVANVLSGVLTLVVLVGVGGFLWWRFSNALAVTAVTVAPAESPGDACDTTVDVVGTVETNGRRGTLRYQWLRNNGEVSDVLEQPATAGTDTLQVHLRWTFNGQGHYDATATLKVLEPAPAEYTTAFTYACG